MYNVTQTFLDKIKSYSRNFDSSITIRDVTFTEDDIISISLSEDVNPADSFMFGSVASSVLEIEIMNVPESLILDSAKVTGRIGVNTGSSFEYVPLGVFWVDEIKKDGYSVKLTCVDNMIKLEKAYFSNLSYPASINSVAQEICTKAGIELATTLPSTQINKIEGYTYREAISFIASFLGGFARFNRLGKLEIVSYGTTNVQVENQFSLTTNEKPFTIGKISCQVGENILTAGSSGNEIQLENPIMTQTQLNNIYNTLKTLNYMPYDMEYEGNPALMAGDKITIVGPDDVSYSTLLMRQKISYTGGLSATASAVGKTEQGQEFSSGGSLKNSVSRMVIEQANIKILLAEKATIEDLTATNAKVENLYATKATIQDLTAAVARIGTLEATRATITDLTAAVARIGVLEAGSATITQLNAANAKIATLETRAASIDTLLAGNLTAANMQANLITAGTTLIADGSIASAKIISLSVDKILAGDISTNKFRIMSSSGNMLISDNTIQIKDITRVRVQIGKDASNDYNMYVWDGSGNLMFDATGLKASGIKAKIIRDDMVSDTANINATKIEKESLVTRINGATTLLLASKVKLDTENQTLEVAFNSLKSTVTTTASKVTSQGTSISAIQGQIQAKIWQQDIDTLEDSLDTRIKSTETSITALNSAISLKVSTSDFNTYKTSNDSAVASKASQSALNTTNGNINSLTTRVSTAESSISVLQNQISLKVEQSDITTAIDNVQIGGRNLFKNSSFKNGLTLWQNWSNGGTNSLVDDSDSPSGKALNAKGNSGRYYSWNNLAMSLIIGEKYIISVKAKGTGVFRFGWEGSSKSYSVTSDYKIYTQEFTCTSNRNFSFYGFSTDADILIHSIKLEKGTKSTDYTEAPEDVTDYTDTQISTAKAEIKVTTDSISSTVSSVQSSVTSLGTRVTSAESSITSLNNAITLKVNTTDFNSYKTTNDSAVSSKASQASLNTTNSNVTALTTRVSTAESSISVLQGQITLKVTQTDINNSINMLTIGGRNLLLNSSFANSSNWSITGIIDTNKKLNNCNSVNVSATGLSSDAWRGIRQRNVVIAPKVGDVYTVSCYVYIDSLATFTDSTKGIGLEFKARVGTSDVAIGSKQTLPATLKEKEWFRIDYTITISRADIDYLFFFVYVTRNGVAWFACPKAEKGNKATDWTPSIEDTQTQIDSAITRISTAESTITQLSSSIALKVETSTYNTKMTSLDSSITSLTSRISAAELKITDSSIVSTVRSSTAYTNDLATKANQSALNTTNSNVTALTTRVSTTESSITQLSTQIQSKVNQGDFGTLITQNVSSVRIAVGQIGGTNLLRDSGFELGYSTVIANSGPVATWGIVTDVHGVLPISGSRKFLYMNCFNRYGDAYVETNMNVNIRAGQTYTVSYDYICAGTISGQSSYMWIGSNAVALWSSSYVADQKWHRMVVKYTATTDTTMRLRFGFIANNAWLAIDNVKIEEGDNATAYSPNPNEASNTSVDVSDAGLTVRNGAISILNNAGTEVLKGDTSGNLTIRGAFNAYNNNQKAVEISNNSIKMYDWEGTSRTTPVGMLYSGRLDGSAGAPALAIGNDKNAYFDIVYQDPSNNNRYSYVRFDYENISGVTPLYDIDFRVPTYFRHKTVVQSDFSCYGSKNSVQDTKNYGERLINAYETAEYYFGDIGSSKIGANGDCFVYIDEIFQECINTNIEYHVFTQVYNGSIAKIERYANYFIVKGEIGTEFSWELKAKRLGYEHNRLEYQEVPEKEIRAVSFNEELDFKLDDFLLGGES